MKRFVFPAIALQLALSSCGDDQPKPVKVPDAEQAEGLAAAERRLTEAQESAETRIKQLERKLSEAEDLQTRQAERIAGLTIQLEQKESAMRVSPAVAPKASVPQSYTVAPTYRNAIVPQYNPPPAMPAAAPPLKWWNPPIQYVAAKDIKAAAVSKWKDNYSMVDHEIQRQTEALTKLTQINRTATKPIKDIIAKAVDKWGTNYNMVVFEVERQTEALRRLQTR